MYEVSNWNCLQNKIVICSYLVVSFYAKQKPKNIKNNNIIVLQNEATSKSKKKIWQKKFENSAYFTYDKFSC